MAQRAYRQRKESTLEELRKRVSELTNTVELMNKIFINCRDRLYASNLPQAQMLDLYAVSAELEELLKDARNPDESMFKPFLCGMYILQTDPCPVVARLPSLVLIRIDLMAD